MATVFATQSTKVLGTTKSTPAPGFVHGSVRCFTEQFALSSQAAADITVVGLIPKGAVFLYGVLETDTSLGSSTISIGVTGTAAKYMAAATFTATDTPTFFGKTAATGVALTADEQVQITWATATGPASGNLRVTLVYAFN